MPKKALDKKRGTLQYYYLHVFHFFIALHKKVWDQPQYNNSPSEAATVVITGLECLNIYALLKHLVFPAARGCAACQHDVRLTILLFIGIFVWVVNLVIFSGEAETPLPTLTHPTVFKRVVGGYILFSILLAQ